MNWSNLKKGMVIKEITAHGACYRSEVVNPSFIKNGVKHYSYTSKNKHTGETKEYSSVLPSGKLCKWQSIETV